jgi:hypothetical protein
MHASDLANLLWPSGSGPRSPQAYLLLDGARDKRIVPMIRSSGLPYECLYSGRLLPELMAAAPYLVQISPESRFFQQVLPRAWGNAWGCFVVARPEVTLEALRRHFRTLLRVQDETGRVMVFRFYDPRVLRVYLPSCTAAERAQFFGPVDSLAWEDEAGDTLIQETVRGALSVLPA